MDITELKKTADRYWFKNCYENSYNRKASLDEPKKTDSRNKIGQKDRKAKKTKTKQTKKCIATKSHV